MNSVKDLHKSGAALELGKAFRVTLSPQDGQAHNHQSLDSTWPEF